MSTSTPAEGKPTVEEILDDPWTLFDAVGQRLDADWTTFYPFVLMAASVVLGVLISLPEAGEGPETVTAPEWAALLVEAVMPLATLLVYPVGLVAAYVVSRLAFGGKEIDASLALAVVAGVATATKAASVMFAAMF